MAVENGKFYYFIVITEALYPNSSYRDPVDLQFDYEADALHHAKKLCLAERETLSHNTTDSYAQPELYRKGDNECGYVVKSTNPATPWCAYCRVFKIESNV